MTRKAAEQVTTVGSDIGKNTFHVIGLDTEGNITLRRKLSRSQVMVRLANLPPCLIGMEACVGAHHLSRQLVALGHNARLMPAQNVKPFLRGCKYVRTRETSSLISISERESVFNDQRST